MSLCSVCKVQLKQEEVVAKCSACSMLCHTNCIKGGERRYLRLKDKHLFLCDNCKDETSSNKSDSDANDDKNPILRAIARLETKVDSKLASIQSSITDIKNDLSVLSTSVASLQVDYTNIKADVAKVQQANRDVMSDLASTKASVAHLDQYSRVNNVIVYGLPSTYGENVYEILRQVAKALGIPYDDSTISIAHRLRAKQNQHPAIIVGFTSRRVRESWLRAAKTKRINASDVHQSFKNEPVFIREHLSILNNDLLRKSRTLVKEGKLAYAWVAGGKVMIRKEVNERATVVDSLKDLDYLLST